MTETQAEEPGYSLLGALPDDMVCHIITHLPMPDRVRMSHVSKHMCRLARDIASGPFHLHLISENRRCRFGVDAAKVWGPIVARVTLDDTKMGWCESNSGIDDLQRLLSLFTEHCPRVQTTHCLTWIESDSHHITRSADLYASTRSAKHVKQTVIVSPRNLDPITYTSLSPHTYRPHSIEFRVESGWPVRWERGLFEFWHDGPEVTCEELERVVLHSRMADRLVVRTHLDGGETRIVYNLKFIEQAVNLRYLETGITCSEGYWTPMRNFANLRHLDLNVVGSWELYLQEGEESFVSDLSFLSKNTDLEYLKLTFEGGNYEGKEVTLPVCPKLSFLSVNTCISNFGAVCAAAATNITELHVTLKRYEDVSMVASNPKLKKLSITIGPEAPKTFADLDPLSQCTSLTSLEVTISAYSVSTFSLGVSGSLFRIRTLTVTSTNDIVMDLSATQGPDSRMMEVRLRDVNVRHVGLSAWPRLRKAVLCDFPHRDVEAVTMGGVGPDFVQLHLLGSELETLEVEGGLRGVRHLLVESVQDPPVELTGVKDLTSLVSLTVTEKLGVYNLEGVGGATGLTSLIIEEASTLEDISELANLKKLKRLNLHGLPPSVDLTPLDSCPELVSRDFRPLERPRIALTKIGARREGSWNSLSDDNEYFDEEDFMDEDDFLEEDDFDGNEDGMWDDMDDDDDAM